MDRINGAGHVNHLFVAEDAETNRPPTEVTEDWLNGVQEELIAIILAAGIVPSTANLSQLLTALRSAGVFTTPAHLDKTTKASTTEFVKNSGLTYSFFGGSSVSAAIPTDACGSIYEFYGATANQTISLPLSGTVRQGDAITILNDASVAVTLARQGADMLALGNSSGITSLVMQPGDFVTMICNGGGAWYSVGGASHLKYSGSFASSLTANGYQKFPSGRIEVQGTFTASATPGAAVPVTFSQGGSNCRNLTLTPLSSGSSAVSAWFDTPTGTGFNGHCSVAGATVHYRAILD